MTLLFMRLDELQIKRLGTTIIVILAGIIN
jgi:hypothetical protein